MRTDRIAIFHQLSWLRAIAAALVALYHIQETLLKPKYFGASAIHWASAGNSGVQLFFVLSGFVIYHAHHRDEEKHKVTIILFCFKRFRRIYPTLWIALTAMLILQYAISPGFSPTFGDIFRAYAIFPATDEVILSVEWTLRHEILFYAVFLIFLWNRRLGTILLVTWALMSAPVAFFDVDYRYLHFFFDQNHTLFLMGIGVAWMLEHGNHTGSFLALGGGSALFLIAYIVEITGFAGHAALVQVYGLATAIAVYGLVTQPMTNKNIAWLERLGAASYAMYLIHNPIVSFAAKAAVAVNRHISLPLWTYAIATFLACQLAAVIFHYVVERRVLRLADRLRPTKLGMRGAKPA